MSLADDIAWLKFRRTLGIADMPVTCHYLRDGDDWDEWGDEEVDHGKKKDDEDWE